MQNVQQSSPTGTAHGPFSMSCCGQTKFLQDGPKKRKRTENKGEQVGGKEKITGRGKRRNKRKENKLIVLRLFIVVRV